MAKREGWTVLEKYSDEGFGAYKGNRGPGLEAARERAAEAAAEAEAAAKKAKTEARPVMLIAQHSDRFSRGAGDEPGAAQALIEIWHFERRRNVHLRSVEDDADLRDSPSVASIGDRNKKDSERKSNAVCGGIRDAALQGKWLGGIPPDGYRVVRTVNERGKVTARVELDPERVDIFRLIWGKALDGWGIDAITLELDRRGAMTNPYKKGTSPRLFDSNRVGQTLNNPFYARLVVHKGKLLYKDETDETDENLVQGHWPGYVSPADFERLRAQRLRRSGPRKRGRPPLGYLLARMAECGVCGSRMDVVTGRGVKGEREDGSRPRRYVCTAHGRDKPKGHSEYCSAGPIDAVAVDTHFAAHLDSFLGDIEGWRGQLADTRDTERARLEREAASARHDVEEGERVEQTLMAKFDACTAAGEDDRADAVLSALVMRRGLRKAAQTRLTATTDALAGLAEEVPVDPLLDFYNRLSKELAGRTDAATGDARRTNLVLQDFFSAVKLTATPEGIRMLPVLSVTAVERILKDPALWPHGVTARVGDQEAAAVTGENDDLTWTSALTDAAVPRPGDEMAVEIRVGLPPAVVAGAKPPPLRELICNNPRPPW